MSLILLSSRADFSPRGICCSDFFSGLFSRRHASRATSFSVRWFSRVGIVPEPRSGGRVPTHSLSVLPNELPQHVVICCFFGRPEESFFSRISPARPTARGESMEIRDLGIFLDYFGKIHERTMRVVRCIPPDKVDWSYRPGKFTLGDLGRHIAAINRYMYAETLQGKPSRYAGCGRELAPTYDDILSFMEARHSESAEIISHLTNLNDKCMTPGWHSHHRLEMAACHGRTRDSPSRSDLHLSRSSGSAHPAALRPHLRAGCRTQRQELVLSVRQGSNHACHPERSVRRVFPTRVSRGSGGRGVEGPAVRSGR